MRRLFFILFLMTGLACFAQDSQEDTSLTSHPSPLTSQKYDAFFLDAICQREKGNNDAAFDLLRHCVELDSTRSEAYYYLAPYYRAMKDKDQQFYCIKKAAELEPHNATYLETLGEAYIAQRQYAEAAEVLEQLYDVNHNRTDVLGMLIQLYEQLEDYDKAIQMLNKLEIAEGKSERLSYAKSQLYTRKGDKRAAIQEMKQLQEQYPNDLNYLCLYANALTMNDQQKQAVRIYEDVLRQEPDNRSALMGLMAYYYDQKDSVKTEQYRERILLNKNVTQEDRVALLRQLIGESEQNGGDSTRVLQLFHRILQMPQSDADMALFCATYMNMKQMPRDSIQAVLEQALAIAPDNAAARLQLVSYAWQAEDKDRVIALCHDARQYNPDEMAFYYYQGIAYYQKDQLDDALNAFQNGISVITDQSDPAIVSDFYAVMGDLLHQKGMTREAFEAYDSCLQWKDDNIMCLNNYAYYLSELGQQLDKAEQMSYKTIKADPKSATYLDTYAWILFMQGRYAEAKVYIDQALQNDSDSSAVIIEHAGDIYAKCGDTGRAVELWQQAQQIDPENKILIRKIKRRKYISK